MLLVYRDVVRHAGTRECVAELRRQIAAGDPVGALIIAGEIEQGILDHVDTDADDWTELHGTLREMVRAAAGLARGRASATQFLRACEAVLAHEPPASISCRAPEGYCHYALDPLAYARAAARYAADGRRCALVVGIRSIGTSLAAVVSDSLNAPGITVRARGESGSRSVIATDRLMQFAREKLADGGDVAIVDEGPGATGETFDVVAQWCRRLGVGDERIVLFPSHAGNSPLAPPARQQWLASAIHYAPPAEERGRAAADAAGFDCAVSISAGAWRSHVGTGKRLPAVCNFERVKYLARRDGRWWQIRFVGAGRWGDAIHRRNCRLAERCCATHAKPLKYGFSAQPWIDGIPLTRGIVTRDDTKMAAQYVSARHRLFPTGQPARREPFLRVLEEHGREAALPASVIAAACRRIVALPEREAFICDAKLAPHEWIRTRAGLWKVDAVDHGNGFRLPGPTDAMWDYAGWIVEFGELQEGLRHIMPAVNAEDEAAAHAYAPVYAAVAFGDALLSAREAADPRDRRMLLREARFYRRAMHRLAVSAE